MPVKFIDSVTETETHMTIPGETYDEVVENAWEAIRDGSVEADDFLVIVD